MIFQLKWLNSQSSVIQLVDLVGYNRRLSQVDNKTLKWVNLAWWSSKYRKSYRANCIVGLPPQPETLPFALSVHDDNFRPPDSYCGRNLLNGNVHQASPLLDVFYPSSIYKGQKRRGKKEEPEYGQAQCFSFQLDVTDWTRTASPWLHKSTTHQSKVGHNYRPPTAHWFFNIFRACIHMMLPTRSWSPFLSSTLLCIIEFIEIYIELFFRPFFDRARTTVSFCFHFLFCDCCRLLFFWGGGVSIGKQKWVDWIE